MSSQPKEPSSQNTSSSFHGPIGPNGPIGSSIILPFVATGHSFGATGPMGASYGSAGNWTPPIDPKDELMEKLLCVQQSDENLNYNLNRDSFKVKFCEKPAEYFYSVPIPRSTYDIDSNKEVSIIYRCFCEEHVRTGHWKFQLITREEFISSRLLGS